MKYEYRHYTDCGKGWQSLIEPLVDLCEENDVYILQVKEKFGELRFYTGSAPEYVLDEIDKACDKSREVCENCGKPGKIRSLKGWLKCLCEICEKVDW